jgi:predicted transcriptional regulator
MASKRSQSYPAFSLDFCIDLVTKIYNEYGTSSLLKRDEIAGAAGVTEATVQMRVSSAVQYGLLERSHGEGYRPSSLFINVYKPLNEEERRNALIEALSKPPLYKKLLEEIDGSIVPSAKALSTILFRKHGIGENASEKAAQTFIDNLNYVRLIDSDNHIRLKRGIGENSVKAEENQADKSKLSSTPTEKAIANSSVEFREINIPLTEKKKAVLLVPVSLRTKDIEIIKAQIDVVALSIED